MIKLPKKLIQEGLEQDVLAALEKNRVPLYEGSESNISLLEMTTELRKHLFYAKSQGELIFGYEDIQKTLSDESAGLKKVNNQSDRVSRLLIVTNDGSKRFYRELEYLSREQGDRVLFARLNIASDAMADVLNLKGKVIKAVLLTRKTSLINVLKSLIA